MSKAQIKDVAFLITKGTTPTTMGEKFVSSGVNFIKAESLSFSKHIDQSVFEHIDKDTDEKLKRSRLEKDDLLFSIAGYLGKMGIVREVDLPANTNQAVAIIRLDKSKIDVDYLYYYLAQNHIQGYINRLSSQSVQPNLNLELLGKLEFENRKIGEQQKIAAVLSALDAKIELNQRINAELESMAKTLYDYWFVQFDFPNEKGKPYKSAGGKMVWNEELKREIPLGWEVETLEDIVKIRNGFAFKSEDYQETGRLIIRTKNFDNNSIVLDDVVYISEEKAKEYSDFELSKFDFLLVMVGASVGKSVITPSYILPALQNQNMWNFLPKNEKQKLYTNFLMSRIVEEQAQSANGSARDFFRKDHFYGLKVAIPDSSIIEEFQKITMPIFEKIDVLVSESQTLTELRDWLLPMLMNGQVKV